MRITASSAITVTASQSLPAVAGLRVDQGSAVAIGLEQISNTPSRPMQSAAFVAAQRFAAITASGPLLVHSFPAAVGTSMSRASAAARASDSPTLEPLPKVMRMTCAVLEPLASHEVAAMPAAPRWPVLPQCVAETNAQADAGATEIEFERPPLRISDASSDRGLPRVASVTESEGPQLPHVIKALQRWQELTPSERAAERSLYKFLDRQNALLQDGKGNKPHLPSTVSQFEWLILVDVERTLEAYMIFLKQRGHKSTQLVHADGTLSEKGYAKFRRTLEQAGLPVPPLAESDAAWQVRVPPFIERWYRMPLSERPLLNQVVEPVAPGRLATLPQTVWLAALDYHVMRSQLHLIKEKSQRQRYLTIKACADANGIRAYMLDDHVTSNGALTPKGSFLSTLLPSNMQVHTSSASATGGTSASDDAIGMVAKIFADIGDEPSFAESDVDCEEDPGDWGEDGLSSRLLSSWSQP